MQDLTTNKDLQKNIAKQAKETELEKLYGIDGLDSVDWWPLAPGWWILITLATLSLIYIIVAYFRKRAWRLSWKGQVHAQITGWQQTLGEDNAQEIAIKASKLARRIAMHQATRKGCASLIGNNWLSYLSKKNNSKFNWQKNGEVFTKEVFAPNGKVLSIDKLKLLLSEMKGWVK